MRTVLRVLRHILLWLLGVALGVAVLLGAVMAASYSFTTDGSLPAAQAGFGGRELAVNGSCWRAPLIGGLLEKAFCAPPTLSVEKLGTLYEAHPEVALPEWATYATLRITQEGAGDAALFEGTLEELKEKAAFEGYPDDNLEDMFLALIEEDNIRRGGVK